MLAVRLPLELEARLTNLAQKTGRTKTYYVRELLQQHIDELEDRFIAIQRLENPANTYSLADVEKQLGLDD